MKVNMESRDTTPEISPLRAVDGDEIVLSEHEEGEISDGSLSDISEIGEVELLEDGEHSGPLAPDPVYDVGRYYGKNSNVDSPASPETRDVTGSPIHIIPGSPKPNPDDVSEDEDIDEDILYLRLMALRSIQDAASTEGTEESEQETLEREMEDLIDEANQASQNSNLEPDPALSELKLNNQQSFMTFSSLENTSEIEESYSPTQSPSKPTPIASPIPDEIIDLVSPVPSPEEIPLPDLPPLPSSPVQPMPPPPSVPPTEPEPGFFSSSLAFDIPPPPPPSLPAPQLRSFSPLPRPIPAVLRDIDEPLPPGEDKLPSAVKNTQFMNQSSEVDAESRFFQSQDFAPAPILFPTSVWGFTAVDPNYGLQAERPSYALETETRNYFQTSYEFAPTLNIETLSSEQTSSISKKRRERRKRKISKHENSIVIKRRRSSGDKEDDENELRAILLAQVSKKQESHQIISSDVSLTMSKESITGKEKEETKSVASLQNSLKKSKRVQIPLSENTQTVVNSVSGLSLEPEKHKSAPILPQLKPQQPLKTKQSALSKLNSTSLVKSKLKTVVKPKTIDSRSALKKKGISKADQKKHFPNLTKTLVIPLNNESESDDDPPPPSNPPESFQLDVEKFLLDIRQTSGSSRKPNPRSSTSTITSRSISVQLKAKAKQLTPAAKKQLITSKISNLPLSKQLEYIKLKTLIARKEMMKQKAKSSSAPQTGGKPIPPLVVAAGNVTDDKKEKLDPKQNMKNKKEMIKMIEMKKKVKAKPTSNVKAEVKLSIEKEMKLNTAIQSTDELKKSTDPVNHPDSKSPEPQELEDEDEKLLRESLLKDLKFKKSSNSAEPSNGLASQNISKGKLTVQLSGNKRNVSVGEISNPTAKLAASNLASSKTTTKPTPTRSATSRPASSKPTSSKSASPKPASTKTAISNPTTTKPASSHPSTSKPAISHPSTTMSASFKPISIKPVGSKPTDSKTVSSNPSNSKPTISKPASVNPSNFKSSTYKPSSPNPSSSKPLLTPSSSKPVSKSSTAPSKVSIPSSVTVKSFLPNPSTSSNLPPSASNTSLTDPSPTEPKVSTNIHLNPGAKPAEKTVPKLIPKPGVDLKLKDELKQTEKSVIMNRNDLSNVLYKLSAQMSQLQRQSIELEGAVSYAAELRNQLRETEQLVKLREEKVENLREVIRNSHQEVTLYKEQMLSAEDTCKRLGDEVYGSEYILPPQGAQNIRNKLAQIKTTAQKVKTTNTDKPNLLPDSPGDIISLEDPELQKNPAPGSIKSNDTSTGIVSGLDYVSPLEHLRSENGSVNILDPNTLLCRFELGGKCMDPTCVYQHCKPAR